MSNPLQPKIIKILEREYNAYVINVTGSSRAGNMDLIACIYGQFYGFEIKWKSDKPSALQRDKINKCLDAGGKAYFVKSEDHLRRIMDGYEPLQRYEVTSEKFRV